MTHKKWICLFLALAILLLGTFGCLTYFLDPLLQFGAKNPLITYYEYDEAYSNPGIAKHWDYNAVLVGTSLAQNTDMTEFARLLHCDPVRLTYSGGTAHNMKRILDVAFSSNNTIDYVYWELNKYELIKPFDKTRNPLPEYLYDTDRLPDLSYLLNLDIFYRFTWPNFSRTIQGEIQPPPRTGLTFSANYSKEGTLASYSRPSKSGEYPDDYYFHAGQQNLDHNILPLIRENPDTTFVFYIAPVSVLFWDYEIHQGTFDPIMKLYEYALPQLLAYDNVEIHFLMDSWEIITDLDNYKDFSHFSPEINSWITQKLADRSRLLTKENCASVLKNTHLYLTSYDCDSLLAE